MFDTHCHLNFSAFDGILEKVISEGKNEGVEKFVVPGTDVETSKKAVEIAKKYKEVFAAVGIHPHHVFKIKNEKIKNKNLPSESEGDNAKLKISKMIKAIENLLIEPKVVAVGEIGLDRHIYQKTKYEDYKIDEEFIALQKEVFLAQLNLAKKYKKTVIIHNRQAKNDLLKILNTYYLLLNTSMVFHCCEPDFDLLDFAKRNHIYIGVDGDVTYDPKKQAFVKEIPLSLLVLETDSPFLTPAPLRNDQKTKFPNTPKNLILIAQKVAEIKGEKVEKIRKITKENGERLFKI
jgi:Mg-dependent DNase